MEWEWNVSRVRGGGAHAFPLLSTQERALFIRRVARFADFERANHPPRHRQLRVNTSKLFCGPRFNFNSAGHSE